MATSIFTIQQFQNSSGTVQLWADPIAQNLANFGWIQTSDTGQLDTSNINYSGTNGFVYGYQIWKMGDTLTPIYLKIEYCNDSVQAVRPGIFISVGTGTDGAGNLTNRVSPRLNSISSTYATSVRNVRVCGDVSRFLCVMPVDSGWGIGFSIERSKDLAGADTEEGVHLIVLGSAPKQYYFPIKDTLRTAINTLTAFYPQGQTTLINDSVISLVPVIAHNQDGLRNPGLSFLVYSGNDIQTGTLFSAKIYGLFHDYYAMGTGVGPYPNPLISGSPATALAMRFE